MNCIEKKKIRYIYALRKYFSFRLKNSFRNENLSRNIWFLQMKYKDLKTKFLISITPFHKTSICLLKIVKRRLLFFVCFCYLRSLWNNIKEGWKSLLWFQVKMCFAAALLSMVKKIRDNEFTLKVLFCLTNLLHRNKNIGTVIIDFEVLSYSNL